MTVTRHGARPPNGSWCVLNLGDPLLADEQLAQVLEAARIACLEGEAGEDLAVFQRHESEGRLHCELKLYFSPGLHALAQSLGARACRVPNTYDLARVAGSEQAAKRLLTPG